MCRCGSAHTLGRGADTQTPPVQRKVVAAGNEGTSLSVGDGQLVQVHPLWDRHEADLRSRADRDGAQR